jgi:hypothetical protein
MNIKIDSANGAVALKAAAWKGKYPQGLKPKFILRRFSARLKSCPNKKQKC